MRPAGAAGGRVRDAARHAACVAAVAAVALGGCQPRPPRAAGAPPEARPAPPPAAVQELEAELRTRAQVTPPLDAWLGDIASVARIRELAAGGDADAHWLLALIHEGDRAGCGGSPPADGAGFDAGPGGGGGAGRGGGAAPDGLGFGPSDPEAAARMAGALTGETAEESQERLVERLRRQVRLSRSWMSTIPEGLRAEVCGIEPDAAEALRRYREAADLGHVAARRRLALRHYFGIGTLQEFAPAPELATAAAGCGDPTARLLLAVMHAWGRGVHRDTVEAYAWANLAARDDPAAAAARDALLARLDFAEIARSQELAARRLQGTRTGCPGMRPAPADGGREGGRGD